jgi:histidine triad (HIT) family protein
MVSRSNSSTKPLGGQVVFHLQVHVLPRREGVPLKPPEKENPGVLGEQAKRLAAALAR